MYVIIYDMCIVEVSTEFADCLAHQHMNIRKRSSSIIYSEKIGMYEKIDIV